MARTLNRRTVLFGGFAATASGCFRLARPSDPEPLSDHARALTLRAWADVDARELFDTHVHVVGLGNGGTGCWVSPAMRGGPGHPVAALRFDIYKRAAGIGDEAHGDEEYVNVLLSRVRRQLVHGRVLILAFDQTYSEGGEPQPALTEFYTPNDYVLRLARENPDAFVPCASIHPYRKDAVDELERCAALGAVAVKWLPNAMIIDPSSPRCDAFYDALARLDVTLLTHAGEEKAVEAEEAQRYGNPLHFRRALDRGVRVVIAHCASLGSNPDLDAPGAPWVNNFDLFARLMERRDYVGRLWGEVSAMTQANRAGRALETVLARDDWHERLLNGSDYPLPAINVLLQTRVLKDRGFITSDERRALNEIDRRNPLQFDFVLKRTLSFKGRRFPPGIFTARSAFPRLRR